MTSPKANILYLLPSYNIYGGTPKKTLDLLKHFKTNASLYVYSNAYNEFKELFLQTGAKIYDEQQNRNIWLHIKNLLKIIDKENINIIHCQFFMGELLGGIIKKLRPHIKLVIAFVGSNDLSVIKKNIIKNIYKKADAYIYISQYVQKEKEKQYPLLKAKPHCIIYNGSQNRLQENKPENHDKTTTKIQSFSIFDVAGLTEIKNIQVLIHALNILINKEQDKNIYLYVAGEGYYRKELERLIQKFNLQEHIFLLGYRKDIGNLLKKTDIFAHPCYREGFGIAVSEAMLAEKPIIVSKSGALPEIIIHNESGITVEPHSPEAWADAIKKIKNNPIWAKQIASEAQKRANDLFSYETFTKQYETFYQTLLK